jgi:hypothetical protein
LLSQTSIVSMVRTAPKQAVLEPGNTKWQRKGEAAAVLRRHTESPVAMHDRPPVLATGLRFRGDFFTLRHYYSFGYLSFLAFQTEKTLNSHRGQFWGRAALAPVILLGIRALRVSGHLDRISAETLGIPAPKGRRASGGRGLARFLNVLSSRIASFGPADASYRGTAAATKRETLAPQGESWQVWEFWK